MILGLQPIVFMAFLSWPITYVVVCLIMYAYMGHTEKKERAWEEAYDEYVKKGGKKGQWEEVS